MSTESIQWFRIGKERSALKLQIVVAASAAWARAHSASLYLLGAASAAELPARTGFPSPTGAPI